MTNLIVPLAGRSSRFSSLTTQPKWSLKLGEESILSWALRSFSEIDNIFSERVLVVREEHSNLLQASLSAGQLRSSRLVTVSEVPNGQAESVKLGLEALGMDSEFWVWNGDTHLKSGWTSGIELQPPFFLTSRLDGDHWSFAKVDSGLVTETAEKRRISDLASVGLYAFSSASQYLASLESWTSAGEIYVAPLYNHLIACGEKVRAPTIAPEYFLPLGTPDEVRAAAKSLDLAPPVELE